MLAILRKLRKSLFETDSGRKYFLYAIGEIALVVIGILIALQINNWNEKQKEIRDLRAYATALANDMRSDIDMVRVIIKQAKRSTLYIDSLSSYVRNKQLDELSNLDLYLLSRPGGYRPYSWNRASMDELKNSGVLRHVSDENLVSMIVGYEALSRHMDEDYLQDVTSRMASENVWNQIVNKNYVTSRYSIRMIDSVKWHDLDEVAFRDFSDDEGYLKMQQEDLQLLARDISEIYAGVNHSRSVRGGLFTRYADELPELIGQAEAIIESLEKIIDGN